MAYEYTQRDAPFRPNHPALRSSRSPLASDELDKCALGVVPKHFNSKSRQCLRVVGLAVIGFRFWYYGGSDENETNADLMLRPPCLISFSRFRHSQRMRTDCARLIPAFRVLLPFACALSTLRLRSDNAGS